MKLITLAPWKNTNLSLLLLATACSFSNISCGVKGPPEPPVPTEASVKKTATPVTDAPPPPTPFAESGTFKKETKEQKKKKKQEPVKDQNK